MAFENLLRPPHLQRFLLALLAGVVALAVYFTAEFFKVVPATAALDEEAAAPRSLGDHSVAIFPASGTEPGGPSDAMTLELIRRLAQVPDFQVVAPRSAFIYAAARRSRERPLPSLDAAWFLEIGITAAGAQARYRALMRPEGSREQAWRIEETGPDDFAPEFMNRVVESLARQFGFEVPSQSEPVDIYLERSRIAHEAEWDWRQAYAEAHEALERAPGDADALAVASTAAFTLGRFDEGMGQLRKAIALDPLTLTLRLKYGLMLEFAGRHQAAIDAYRELMVIDPDFPGVHAYLGRTLVIVGRTEAGHRHAQLEVTPFWRRYGVALSLYALDRVDEADTALESLVDDHGSEAAVQIAEIHAFAGRPDEAFEWLDTAIEQRDGGVASLVGNPLFNNVNEDPRWAALLERLDLPAE